MATASHPNPRASLLAGLRTGGVRSTSATIPNTAAPAALFTVPRFASQQRPTPLYEDGEDQVLDFSHRPNFNNYARTAAVDGSNNSFAAQQMSQRGLNPNSTPFSPSFIQSRGHGTPYANSNQMQNQAFQMQMLQLEMLRIQQAQQLQAQAQAEMMAQTQRQLQMQNQTRRANVAFNPPSTAGPIASSFNSQSQIILTPGGHANQAELLRSQPGVADKDELPMTAALGGKFGSRIVSLNAAGHDISPPVVSSTTVISGGTSLGNLSGAKVAAAASKSDAVSSWRRSGNNNSVLSGNNRAVSSPCVKITPPPEQLAESPSMPSIHSRFRPQPLRFTGATTSPLSVVAIDTSDSPDNDDTSSCSSSAASNSSPNTPGSSNGSSLSPREEASKKLYEGLGIGRPTSAISDHHQADLQHQYLVSVATHRMVSQPTRQPRGPPSGADELGPKNFATRIRRQAIDGLGILMDARERRELVEVY